MFQLQWIPLSQQKTGPVSRATRLRGAEIEQRLPGLSVHIFTRCKAGTPAEGTALAPNSHIPRQSQQRLTWATQPHTVWGLNTNSMFHIRAEIWRKMFFFVKSYFYIPTQMQIVLKLNRKIQIVDYFLLNGEFKMKDRTLSRCVHISLCVRFDDIHKIRINDSVESEILCRSIQIY